uniref:Transmembrane 9 superfamily member n=1 Tax=Oryza glumipatula TaxID=40148 RepID=A0A0E0B6H8_9ORYZ
MPPPAGPPDIGCLAGSNDAARMCRATWSNDEADTVNIITRNLKVQNAKKINFYPIKTPGKIHPTPQAFFLLRARVIAVAVAVAAAAAASPPPRSDPDP